MLFNEKIDINYLRLSKEDGDVESGAIEESCSIGSQRKCIEQYLRRKGIDPSTFEEIVDDGFSGTSMDRPGMKKLLRLVDQAGYAQLLFAICHVLLVIILKQVIILNLCFLHMISNSSQ